MDNDQTAAPANPAAAATPAAAVGAPAAASTAAAADPQNTAELIEAWFVEHFHNSIVSRAGTEVYNHVHAAKDVLQADIAGLEADVKTFKPADAVAHVEAWFRDHFQDSPISRVSQEAYNYAVKAKDVLKTRLTDFL